MEKGKGHEHASPATEKVLLYVQTSLPFFSLQYLVLHSKNLENSSD